MFQVICLELRGPGSLTFGASSAGPVVGTSKDQRQVIFREDAIEIEIAKRIKTNGTRIKVTDN